MKYFVGYLIGGEAGRWHVDTAKKISKKFDTWKMYEKVPPHITIYYLDDVKDIGSIKEFIKDWAARTPVLGNFRLAGFGRFEDKVVFAKVETDKSVADAVEGLRRGIKEVSGVSKGNSPDWHPHATLAHRLSPEEIENIWRYVNELDRPSFIIPFDSIALFKYTGDKEWVVDESFFLSNGSDLSGINAPR